MNKILKYSIILLCFGCSSTKVVYDYDAKADFKKYKTFLFYADAGKGLSQLDVKRFKRSIVSELDTLGIKPSENPDFYINLVVERTKLDSNTSFGVDFGRQVGNVGIATNTTIGNKKINEKITIEFVNGITNMIFWEATTSSAVKERYKPLERVAYVEKIIDKILKGYPPKR